MGGGQSQNVLVWSKNKGAGPPDPSPQSATVLCLTRCSKTLSPISEMPVLWNLISGHCLFFAVHPFPLTGSNQQSSQIITWLMAQDIIKLAL